MKINKYEQIIQADEIIKEFQYRQVETLTKFELLCSKKGEKTRDAVVASFEGNADEMSRHGYYATYYHKNLKTDLKKMLGLSFNDAEAVMLSYHFLLPFEREKFKRHLLAGVIEQRSELYRLKPNQKYKRDMTVSLGEMVLGYQSKTCLPSPFNIPFQLSTLPQEDKEKIKDIFLYAAQVSTEQGIDKGIQNLTNAILPYYFKEVYPCLKTNSKMALCTAMRTRPQKFFKINKLLNTFGWLFLTQHPWDQERTLKNLYHKENKRSLRKMLRRYPEYHYHD